MRTLIKTPDSTEIVMPESPSGAEVDATLDRIAWLAAEVLAAPIACVSLIDSGRQYIAGTSGMPGALAGLREIPIEHSICRHVSESGAVLAVVDASADPRFAAHAAVRAFGMRGYLGVPLTVANGRILGVLCAVDTSPREWTEHDRQRLLQISAVCATELTLRDEILQRQQAERRADEADGVHARRTDAILDIALDAVVTVDHVGRIMGFNRAAEEMFNFRRELVMGELMADVIIPPSFRAAHRAGFARTVETGESRILGQRVEVTAMRGDGSEFPAELAINRLPVDGPPMFTAFIRDISDRVRADAAMRESERRFRQLTDNIHEVFWLAPARGDRILYVSAAYEDIWGRPASDLTGGRTAFLDTVHPEDRARSAAALAQMADGGAYDIEYRIVRPNGSVRWIHDRAFPVRDESGAVVRMAGIAEDITARRASNSALRESEELFRALTEGSNEIVAVVNADGTSRYLSPSFARVLGHDPDERTGTSILEMTHPDDVAAVLGAIARVRTKPGNTETLTHRHLHKDGRYRILETNATNLIEHPAVEGIVCNTRDITARADAERALRESVGRLERITANVPGVVFQLRLGVDGKIAFPYVSDAAWALFGVDPARAQADPRLVLDLIDPTDLANLRSTVLASARTLSAWQWEGRIGPPESPRWVEGNARPQLQSDGSVLYDAIILDVTHRRHAEEAIRFQAQLLDTVEQAVVTVDLGLTVTWWNRYAETLYGYTAEEAIGRPLAQLIVPAGDRTGLELWQEVVRTGTSRSGEVRRVRKDGSHFLASLSVTPTTLPDGTVTGLVGVAVDATERRSLEEQLRQAQKMEAVGRLAGGVAHDFNNLLTVVRLHSELLLESAPRGTALHEDLSEIAKATARGAALTRQLLAFSRQQVLEPKALSLESVMHDLERMLSRLIGEDVELVTRVEQPSEGGRVLADPGQVEQVIVNLALNARDAMPRGGVLIISTGVEVVTEAEQRAREPEGMPIPPGRYATLEVRDTGVGMDAPTRARIFEPFFTTKPVGEGSGLGLATVYGIVEQSGGFIALDSTPGIGTAFKIHLPLVAAAPEHQELTANMPAPVEEAKRVGETILLVEDEQAVRTLARRILTQRGYRVIEAANGREALEIARTQLDEIDALVTDAVMPEMGGPELAKQLHAMRPGLRTLFMSGYTDDDILRRGELQPGAAFLQKPFSTEQFARAVRDILDVPGSD